MSADPSTAGLRREVRVGDRVLIIEPPNAFKFLETAELIGQISEQVPELTRVNDEFVADFRRKNQTVLTRPVAIITYPNAFDGITDEWWQEQENKIVLPGGTPDGFQQGLAMFKHVYGVAREPLLKMIAVLACPAGELETADEGGTLDEYLKAFTRKLVHQAKLTDLLLIVTSSIEAMRDEFAADAEAATALGEIQALLGRRTPTAGTQTQSEPSSTQESSQEPPAPDLAPAPPVDESTPKPTSSTDSPTPTDGTDVTSSTAPAGPFSESSVPASAAAN